MFKEELKEEVKRGQLAKAKIELLEYATAFFYNEDLTDEVEEAEKLAGLFVDDLHSILVKLQEEQ